MPVMGGIEAARRIRALPGRIGKVFIAALTAQAQAGVSVLTSAAGMNGFLLKPISAAPLEALLAKAAALPAAEATVNEQPGQSLSFDGLLDRNMLDDLRNSVGHETFVALVEQFGVECAIALDTIADLLQSGDDEPLRRNAHKLCGLFGQFGMSKAAEIAEAIEVEPSPERRLVLGRRWSRSAVRRCP